MTRLRLPRAHRRRRSLLITVVSVVTALAMGIGVWTVAGHTTSPRTPANAASEPAAQAPSPSGPLPADLGQSPAVQRQLAQLRAMPAIAPDPAARSRISADARSQPDLYAVGFVTSLLTQDYRRTRSEFLAWVAAESATTAEPLVVGLVPPELRDRLAVFSVTDQSDGPGTSPVPSPAEWARLAALGGYTTVTDVRATEPLAWSNAVDAGRVTDPGVTAREVTATVTLHTTGPGGVQGTRYSVSLTADFEGPPTRSSWGFVNAVRYTSLMEGAS